ncbi:MAG: MFS transporter, partial [Actinomycetota bacterium]
MASRWVVDITPLRESRRFRRLYLGHLLGFMGRQMTVVAVPYQVFILTDSNLAVGALGLVQFLPLLVTSVVGGAVADAVDRRKLLVVSQILLAATATGLAFNAALAEPAVWPLYVLSGLNAGLSAIANPARMAAIPSLLRRDLLAAGFALNQTMTQVGIAVGPALAGYLIARFSLTATYTLEAVAFVAAAVTMAGLGSLRPEGGGRKADFSSIREGLTFLRGHRLIQSLFIIDLNAMIFGMPRALFPDLGTGFFAGDASTVGLLYAAPGVGAFAAALTSGWVGGVTRKGRVVVLAVIAWGVAIGVFGLTPILPLALVLLAVAGGADVISAVFRATILQLALPDALRGRLSAVSVVEACHTGRLAAFTERAAARGVAAFMAIGTVGEARTAPHGGAGAVLGTNPVSFSLPNPSGPPVTLDFATSAIAAGKVKVALAK